MSNNTPQADTKEAKPKACALRCPGCSTPMHPQANMCPTCKMPRCVSCGAE